jgi:hypothetical protein
MTYEQVAARYGVPLCSRCKLGHTKHRDGTTVLESGMLHWAPRRLTRPGLWNFLKLVADQRWGIHGRRQIERLWMANTMAYEFGLELGVRFPREYAATDRARVRALLAVTKPALDPETRRRIVRWARA